MAGEAATAQQPIVARILAELAACRTLHAYIDMMSIMAARYQVGQHWRSGISNQAGIVIPPKVSDENPRVTANICAAHVRQWDSRLGVRDLAGAYEPLDGRPEIHLTARILQAWHDFFIRENNPRTFHNDLSFARLICGTAIGTWYFDERRPGGIGLAVLHPGRLTIDPANRSWDLDDHEYVIQTDVLSCDEARRRYGKHFENDLAFQSDATIGQLRMVDSYLGSALYGLQPGGGESITKGVIVYRRFSDHYRKLQVVIHNPAPSWKEKERRSDGSLGRSAEYFVVGEWPWRWGNPYLKLDCFRNVACAIASGLVAELVPTQNLINLAVSSDLVSLLAEAGGWRWVAYKDTIHNPEAMKKGRAGSTIWLTPKAYREKLAPQIVAPPAGNRTAANLFDQANFIMSLLSSVTPTLQGQGVKRGQAYAAYELLRREGLAILESVASEDQGRTERFWNRVARAAVDHYGRTNPGYLANIVGRSLGSPSLGRVASKTILAGPTACVLRRSAFLALSAQEKEARLMALAQAGRIDPKDLPHELFEQTGYPLLASQQAAYQQAQEIIRRILNNEPDGQFDMDDDLEVALRCINNVMVRRVTLCLTRKQRMALHEAKTEVLDMLAEKRGIEAGIAGVENALAGPGAQRPPESPSPSAPIPMMQGAGEVPALGAAG